MSKFFEALERADREQVALPPAAPSAEPPTAPSAEPPPAPARVEPPLFDTPAPALATDGSNRVEEHLVSLLAPASVEAERYRMLRHVVETLRKDANLQVVAITSPGGGDGKTTVAINLAGALAQSVDSRVLLVDCDLRRPAVGRQLGLGRARRSLVDALARPGLTLDDTVEHLARFNLSVLPAGESAVAPYELLRSPKVEALLEEARRRYDYIVVDTPPFAPVPDGRLISKWVDGFLVVVAAHRTPRQMLAETLGLMDPEKVTGLVFNGDDARPSSYYSYEAVAPRSSFKALWRWPWRKNA